MTSSTKKKNTELSNRSSCQIIEEILVRHQLDQERKQIHGLSRKNLEIRDK